MPPDTLPIGVLGRPHGVAGEIFLRPYDHGGDAVEELTEILVGRDGRWGTRRLIAWRRVNEGYLVRLDGVKDREAAAALTLSEVRASRAALPPLEPGEFYVEDVPGLAVEDESGRSLGTVQGTFWSGAHDIATVVAPDGTERLIPLVPAHVVSVDVPGRKMLVRWDDDDDQ
ncbi:MAG TPA: ribosome maturation factor RimM [Polyangia bacterium]|nr:ribosome maturation factor RimM [Polyangia bacterium]